MKKYFPIGLLFLFLLRNTAAEKPVISYYGDAERDLMLTPNSAALAGADMSLSSGAVPSSSPANLAFDSLHTFLLSYSNYFQNSFSTSMLSYSAHNGNAGYSITAGYIFVPDIEITKSFDSIGTGSPVVPDKIPTDFGSDVLIRVGYGRYFSLSGCNLAFGGALNARRRSILEYKGYGLGLDAGVTAQIPSYGVSASLVVENITSSYTYWSSSFSEYVLPHLRIGIGWDKAIPYIYGRLVVAYTTPDLLTNEGVNDFETRNINNDYEIETPRSQKFYKHPSVLIYGGKFGAEYTFMNRLALRVGVNQRRICFGAGLSLFDEHAGFDFAYNAHELAGSYQMSLKYRW